MTGKDIIEKIGLDRARYVNSKNKKLLETESIILDEISEKEFGVDSVYFNIDEKGNSFPAIFLKRVNSFDRETLQKIAEVHRKVWNYKKVLFLYVYSDTEIRIYNCSEKPLIKTKDSFKYEEELKQVQIKAYDYSDKEQLEELNSLFSRVAIDSGVIWTLEEAQFIRDKIDLQRRVDKYLVTSLINTAKQLEEEGLNINLIHKIILRSLFLLYLEDRGATDGKLYSQIKKGAKSYFDILEDPTATKLLYKRLEHDFNGNVFTVEDNEGFSGEQLQFIKKCFINGNDNIPQSLLFEDWRLFDFSIIQIELLSEIYENFLHKTDPELKKRTGTYYTPPALVEFILNQKLPIGKTEKEYDKKILDPSCGSGIFLVESFKRLVKRYENHHRERLTDFNQLKKLLTDNIFGIEIHSQAIKVAAFSLYLALVDKLDPKTLWQEKKHRLPNLINNPADKSIKEQGKNLFCRDTIEDNKEVESIEFDLVVGNPPFGTTELSDSIRKYCDEHDFAKEKVLPFLHKATTISPNGEIALIFNTKVLTNTGGTYQNFRKWLFNHCYVEKVFNFSILRKAKKNFGGQLFGDATGPISIVFYQKNQPKNPEKKIAYYAPKTYIKSNVIEGLSIDWTDFKYLPREECQKPNTKIWKVAMWGGMNDWELINDLYRNHESFKDYLIANHIDYGSGLHPKENDIKKMTFEGHRIDTEKIESYYTPKTEAKKDIKEFRSNNVKLFKRPLTVIKEGITNKRVLSSYFDYDVLYNKAVYGFSGNDSNKQKSIAIIFNSNLSNYFFFLTSSSWGVERDRIILVEYLSFPYVELNLKGVENIPFSEILFEKKPHLFKPQKQQFSYRDWEQKISRLYNLSSQDVMRISDTVSLSIDLFHKQEKSIALYPVLRDQVISFGKLISDEINNFLYKQNLFVNATVYDIKRFTPLMIVKLSFGEMKRDIYLSDEVVDDELKKLDTYLWEKKSTSIYFRKKLNYKAGNDIYLIRPNQSRFWSCSMALEDASELILEILNEQ